MTGVWWLILTMAFSGPAIKAIPFESQQACEAAAKNVREASRYAVVSASCSGGGVLMRENAP